MDVQQQASFDAGMWRTRRAPENAFFDGVNVLLNDEGEPFKRGGSAMRSSGNAGATLLGLADGFLLAGARTVMWATQLYALDGALAPVAFTTNGGPAPLAAFSRPAVFGGIAFFPSAGNVIVSYAGSLKPTDYSTGTISIPAGSDTVTGTGTAWLANVDPGMLFLVLGGTDFAVKSVTSNTSLKLSRAHPTGLVAGNSYTASAVVALAASTDLPATGNNFVAATAYRLLVANGGRVAFSDSVGAFTAGDYHELPAPASIVGLDVIGDTAIVFTTEGVWGISNLDLDALDDFGNVQHQVHQLNKDLVLWADPGVASWAGSLVVPAVDDVYLFSLTAPPQSISEAIRPLYRSYVAAGYTLGTATVHRGHYLLPILNGTTLVDVLVCRLDRGFAWTRWAGHAAGGAYAQRVGGSVRQPLLLGVSAERVTDLTGCFAPTDANRQDAVGGAPAFDLITRDFDTGPGIRGGILRHVRLEYDLVAPSALAAISVSTAAGAEAAAFTAHSVTAPEADGGSKTWMLNRFGERVRVRFQCSDATADLRLRRLEMHMEAVQRP